MNDVDIRCTITELPASMCAHCRGLRQLTQAEYRARRLAGGVPDDAEHGIDSTYGTYHCHCPDCRGAHAEAAIVRRIRNGEWRDYSPLFPAADS